MKTLKERLTPEQLSVLEKENALYPYIAKSIESGLNKKFIIDLTIEEAHNIVKALKFDNSISEIYNTFSDE